MAKPYFSPLNQQSTIVYLLLPFLFLFLCCCMPTNFEFTYHRKERDGGWFVGGGWKEEFNTLHGLFFVTTYSISYNKILLLLRCSWNMNSNNENIINIDLDWFECEALFGSHKSHKWLICLKNNNKWIWSTFLMVYLHESRKKKWWDFRHIKAYIFDLKSIFAVHFFLGRLFVHSFVSIGNIKHELSLN